MSAAEIFNLVSLSIGIAGSILGYVFYQRSRRFKSFGYTINTELVLQRQHDVDGLKIKFRDKDIAYLYRVSLKCWNAGTATILGNDVNEHNPLELTIPASAKLLVNDRLRSTETHVAPSVTSAENMRRVSFSQMEPGDGFELVFLVGAETDIHLELKSDTSFKGSIIGVKGLGQLSHTLPSRIWEFSTHTLAGRIITLLMMLSLFFVLLWGLVVPIFGSSGTIQNIEAETFLINSTIQFSIIVVAYFILFFCFTVLTSWLRSGWQKVFDPKLNYYND